MKLLMINPHQYSVKNPCILLCLKVLAGMGYSDRVDIVWGGVDPKELGYRGFHAGTLGNLFGGVICAGEHTAGVFADLATKAGYKTKKKLLPKQVLQIPADPPYLFTRISHWDVVYGRGKRGITEQVNAIADFADRVSEFRNSL